MKVRLATLSDLSNIITLWWEMQIDHLKYDKYFYETKSEEKAKDLAANYFANALKDKNHIIIVLEQDQQVVGMLHCEIIQRPPVLKEEQEAFICEASITQRFRGQGLFQLMFELLKTQLEKRNIHLCNLLLETENLQGFRAYKKCGFQERQKFLILRL
ncbi:MAG TPA: GNAT family N-acetyltransferase [Candidatus Deferrimicrobium sp.]|nr:GNAT family N-acetyltransferase [Candidatus Deferrimicrobium sp.]